MKALPVFFTRRGILGRCANVLYTKIASTNYEDAEKFAAVTIKQMASKRGKPKEKIDKRVTGSGQPLSINEYPATKT